MKRVDLRRHSVRDPPEPLLSDRGRALAVEVGRRSGPYELVVSSPAPRARQTAEAMGFLPNAVREVWYELGEVPWPLTFAQYHDLASEPGPARALAERLRAELYDIVDFLAEGGAALVLTHGGFPELSVAALGSREAAARLGGPCRCLEGVRLGFDDRSNVRIEGLRVAASRTRL